MKCAIFRCSKKQEMYLYATHQEDDTAILDALPDGLKQLTGVLTRVMDLELNGERKLARVDVRDVIAALDEKGYYLQYPPNEVLRGDESVLHNPSDTF